MIQIKIIKRVTLGKKGWPGVCALPVGMCGGAGGEDVGLCVVCISNISVVLQKILQITVF